ncbi:unnamed protein product [Clonostachys rosea]|uniref:C2H2-type domain-containing protein n=1 Tax=Bionectria ochroleuca TaxID=29856 RepID=A0ABY6UN49_BIOOC|nr:unnamed protein product [Clonostachys rosea]
MYAPTFSRKASGFVRQHGAFFVSGDASGLPADQLGSFTGSFWGAAGEMLTSPYPLAANLSNWSFDATNGDNPLHFRNDFETSPSANELMGFGNPAITTEAGGTDTPKACLKPGCSFSAKTNRDMKRHDLAVHEKAAPFFCTYPGCIREQGFARKDSRDRHVKHVHDRKRNSPVRSVARVNTMMGAASGYAVPEASEPAESGGVSLDSISKEEAVYLLNKEMRMRKALETKLREFQKRNEERDEMLMSMLSHK